jgi:hypothetical protein
LLGREQVIEGPAHRARSRQRLDLGDHDDRI